MTVVTESLEARLQRMEQSQKNIEAMLQKLLKLEVNGDEVDVHEAARICGLSPQTIYNYLANGKLRVSKRRVGRDVFLKRADIIKWNTERTSYFNVRQL